MTIFTYVKTILGEEYPELEICTANGGTVSVFQWQCYGEANANEFGVTKTDELFTVKAKEFVNLAIEKNASIVCTPEYSFPYVILDEILKNKSLWPHYGKLWCLGTQGDNIKSFLTKLEQWNSYDNISIVREGLDEIEEKTFISPLIYLFLLKSGQLCVLIQLKTGPMADPRLIFEGVGLCRGNKIFVFCSAPDDAYQNAFFSIICADALYVTPDEIITQIQAKSIMIFHPQLNPNPKHESILNFRNGLYSRGDREFRLLTLNWSFGTTIRNTGKEIKFDTPWSAFYKKKEKVLTETESSYRNSIMNNHKKGTAYAYNSHVEIWYSHRHEHCKLMNIRKGYNGTAAPVVANSDEPSTENCYFFKENKWNVDPKICCSNVEELFKDLEIENEFPYPTCNEDGQCDKCKKSDFFFGSLLGHFEDGEHRCENEFVSRIMVGSDADCDREREQKIALIIQLKNQLDKGNLPLALNYLSDNYKFEISEEFPQIGNDRFNVVPIKKESENPEVLAVICNDCNKARVEKKYKEVSLKLGRKYRDQILLYYRNVSGDISIFDDHLTTKNISNPNFSDNITSIKKLGSKFRR